MDLKESDKVGRSPATRASYHGFLEIIQFLAQQGVDLQESDKQGFSPATEASARHDNLLLFLRFRFAVLAVAAANFHIQVCIPKLIIFHEP